MTNKNTKITYLFIGIIVMVLGICAVYALNNKEESSSASETSSTPTTAREGEHCGGNMSTALSCSMGYHCAPVPGSHLPFGDVGGVCVKD